MTTRAEAAPRTAGEMLQRGRAFLEQKGVPEARLSAELLVAHALDLDRLGLFLQLDRPVAADELDRARELLVRRARREPVAYITGRREFYGRSFEVGKDVLVPRPETELLIDLARERAAGGVGGVGVVGVVGVVGGADGVRAMSRAGGGTGLEVGDFGTGSGCIAITIALELPGARVHAVDVSPAALICARANAERLGTAERVRIALGDAPAALLAGEGAPAALDLLLSNPPYIEPAEAASLPPEVRDYEPAAALFTPAGDPHHWLRRLCDEGLRLLAPGGVLLVELGYRQEEAALELARDRGLAARTHRDLDGVARVFEVSVPGAGGA